jgi:hypothetical protein
MRYHNGVFAAILPILMGAWTTDAAANEGSPVSMEFEDCARFSTGEVERILGLELRTIANGRSDVSATPSTVRVRCDTARIHLEIDNAKGKTQKQIVVAEESSGEDQERLIALAAAELVLLSWQDVKEDGASSETPKESPPPSKSAQPVEQKKESDAPVPGERLVSVSLGALWRIFFEGLNNSFGGELSLSLHPSAPLFFRTAVTLEGGHAARALGDVSLFAVSGALSIGLEKSLLKEKLSISAETGFRAGYGRLEGLPNEDAATGDTLDGSFGGPMLCLSAASRTKPYVKLSVEGGYAPWGVTGSVNADSPVALKGFWLGVGVIIGYP